MDFDDLEDAEALQDGLAEARRAGFVPATCPLRKIQRLWCISDVYCDHEVNFKFLERISGCEHDALILLGNVSHKLQVLTDTLLCVKERFAEVIFVPGNQDLWVKNDPECRKPGEEALYKDSFEKLKYIITLCDHVGVHTTPRVFEIGDEALWVVPLLAWHARSFDTEPEVSAHWGGIPDLADMVKDFQMCIWPADLKPTTDLLAEEVDCLNDRLVACLGSEERLAFEKAANATPGGRSSARVSMVTCSHFVPLLELNPEKRLLFYPEINKTVGSRFLRERVEDLHPDVHVFGHTHFGWDSVIGRTRFVQAPLALPRERSSFSVTVIGDFPCFDAPAPLLLRSGPTWAAPYPAAWTEYYKRYPREKWRTSEIQERAMNMYQWLGEGDPPSAAACFENRLPPWELAPPWVYEKTDRRQLGFDGKSSYLSDASVMGRSRRSIDVD
mmetsp:Transcript_154781/g.269489  ORF Transcript_154781/g.269489 Transcript_154781/m.269489 type:complete len:443 (-) Transcript_154781:21-1349(-)